MSTSLVTGDAGFLGSHPCDHLLARGQRVICVDNLETGSLDNVRHLKDGRDFRFELVDITTHYEVDEPVDFVFHGSFEALPIDDPKVRRPDITRAQALLGWEPQIDIREGLRRTIEHYTRVIRAPA